MAALAEMAGLSKGFVSQLETGARKPSTETVAQLASAFGVSPAEVFDSLPGYLHPSTVALQQSQRLDVTQRSGASHFSQDGMKISSDGKVVRIIAAVEIDGLDRLIRRLQALKDFLES